MRILPFILIISLSLFTKGQNVLLKLKDTVVYDDFSLNRYNFPQKYNPQELSVIENGVYRIKRSSDAGYSFLYLKTIKPFYTYEMSASIEIVKNGNSRVSGGLVLNGQTGGNGALLLETNIKRQYRLIKISNNTTNYITGSSQNKGWIKSNKLNKKGFNTIKVRVDEGEVDYFINDSYVGSHTENQYLEGKIGVIASARSEILVDHIVVKKASKTSRSSSISTNSTSNNTNSSNAGNPAFEEVILIFKTKIDQQQSTISRLQKEVDKCRSMLNYDTNLVAKSADLETMNKFLSTKLDSTSRSLAKATKRLQYLESMKADIESGTNGDLVMSLTSILSNVKKENNTLREDNKALSEDNDILKKDNSVLLREIERLKYLIKIKE